jgi:deoxyribose-phosphate aldolase
MTKTEIAKLIDHTLLRPDATSGDIERLCQEAARLGFHSVCINPSWVHLARDILSGSDVKVTTVIGFPLGSTFTKVKVFEAMEAVLHGGHELDIVMNVGLAKSDQWTAVEKDISDIIAATPRAVHKVIIETCFLSTHETIQAAGIVANSGAEFIKTSTGFGTRGATVGDIAIIKSVVKERCSIKASGGIRTLHQVREFFKAGATRIGTSSGVAIMEEFAEGFRRGAE